MAVKLEHWEVRNLANRQLMKRNNYESYTLNGFILGKEYRFKSSEITHLNNSFIINETNEEVEYGEMSKLYKTFLRGNAVPFRFWNMFYFDGDLWIEGYRYNSHDYETFRFSGSYGPFIYDNTGVRYLLDIGDHQSQSKIKKDYFPYGMAPDLF